MNRIYNLWKTRRILFLVLVFLFILLVASCFIWAKTAGNVTGWMLITLAVCLVGWLLIDLIVRAFKRKKQRNFDAKMLAREGIEDRKQEWEVWSKQMRENNINRYDLPFYLLVGEPQAGKSVMLHNSELHFPFGQSKLSGPGGTRGCDWWFTEEAVILDLAGRLFTHEGGESDAAEWEAFLEMLADYRPLSPANGVILVIPCDSLLRDSEETTLYKAGRIQDALLTLVHKLEAQFPIYVVCTKADQIFGFAETVHRMGAEKRQEMFGWSRSALDYDKPFHIEEFREGFEAMIRRSGLLRSRALSEARIPDALMEVDRMYAFPDELASLRRSLESYLKRIFGESSLVDRLFFRGVYLTSGLQKGVPVAKACSALFGGSSDAEEDARDLETLFSRQRAYFIRDLVRGRVFRERGLVRPTSKRVKRARTTMLVGYGTAIFLAVLGTAAFAYDRFKGHSQADVTTYVAALDRLDGYLGDSDPDQAQEFAQLVGQLEGIREEAERPVAATIGLFEDVDERFADLFCDLSRARLLSTARSAAEFHLDKDLDETSEDFNELLARIDDALLLMTDIKQQGAIGAIAGAVADQGIPKLIQLEDMLDRRDIDYSVGEEDVSPFQGVLDAYKKFKDKDAPLLSTTPVALGESSISLNLEGALVKILNEYNDYAAGKLGADAVDEYEYLHTVVRMRDQVRRIESLREQIAKDYEDGNNVALVSNFDELERLYIGLPAAIGAIGLTEFQGQFDELDDKWSKLADRAGQGSTSASDSAWWDLREFSQHLFQRKNDLVWAVDVPLGVRDSLHSDRKNRRKKMKSREVRKYYNKFARKARILQDMKTLSGGGGAGGAGGGPNGEPKEEHRYVELELRLEVGALLPPGLTYEELEGIRKLVNNKILAEHTWTDPRELVKAVRYGMETSAEDEEAGRAFQQQLTELFPVYQQRYPEFAALAAKYPESSSARPGSFTFHWEAMEHCTQLREMLVTIGDSAFSEWIDHLDKLTDEHLGGVRREIETARDDGTFYEGDRAGLNVELVTELCRLNPTAGNGGSDLSVLNLYLEAAKEALLVRWSGNPGSVPTEEELPLILDELDDYLMALSTLATEACQGLELGPDRGWLRDVDTLLVRKLDAFGEEIELVWLAKQRDNDKLLSDMLVDWPRVVAEAKMVDRALKMDRLSSLVATTPGTARVLDQVQAMEGVLNYKEAALSEFFRHLQTRSEADPFQSLSAFRTQASYGETVNKIRQVGQRGTVTDMSEAELAAVLMSVQGQVDAGRGLDGPFWDYWRGTLGRFQAALTRDLSDRYEAEFTGAVIDSYQILWSSQLFKPEGVALGDYRDVDETIVAQVDRLLHPETGALDRLRRKYGHADLTPERWGELDTFLTDLQAFLYPDLEAEGIPRLEDRTLEFTLEPLADDGTIWDIPVGPVWYTGMGQPEQIVPFKKQAYVWQWGSDRSWTMGWGQPGGGVRDAPVRLELKSYLAPLVLAWSKGSAAGAKKSRSWKVDFPCNEHRVRFEMNFGARELPALPDMPR